MDKRRPQAVFCASTRPLSAALYRTVCADKPDERAPLPRTARSMRQASNCAFERFELSRPERALSSLREGARRRQLILPGYAFRLVCFETFFRKSSIGRTLPRRAFLPEVFHPATRLLHWPIKSPAALIYTSLSKSQLRAELALQFQRAIRIIPPPTSCADSRRAFPFLAALARYALNAVRGFGLHVSFAALTSPL